MPKKKLLIVIGAAVLFLVCIMLLKDQIMKSGVTMVASQITGAPVHIDGFSFDIFTSTVHIAGLKIDNPDGFPPGVLVYCSKINVVFDRDALFKHRLHLISMEIELDQMGLTRNKEGKLNVDSLKIVKQPKASPPVPMQIDFLTLGIGKIVSKDYTGGTTPGIRVHDVNIHKSYKNITSAQQLAVLVLAEPVKAAGIKSAEIYGVSMLAGVAILPVTIAATFIGQDSARQTVDAASGHVYEVSLEVIKEQGRITREDAANGIIKADIKGAMVALKLDRTADNKTEITVSARKFMFPMPDIAGGVLYEVLEGMGKNVQ